MVDEKSLEEEDWLIWGRVLETSFESVVAGENKKCMGARKHQTKMDTEKAACYFGHVVMGVYGLENLEEWGRE